MVKSTLITQAIRLAGLLLLLVLCGLPALAQGIARVGKVECLGPNEGFGVIKERFRFSMEVTFPREVTGQITAASVNGAMIFEAAKRSNNPNIETMDAGKNHLGGERVVEPAETIFVQFYHSWIAGQTYKLAIAFRADDGKTFTAESPAIKAPEGGAITAYPSYSVITVKERGGMSRARWPVTVGLTLLTEPVHDPYRFLYLVRYDQAAKNEPVPLHVFDIVSPELGPELLQALEKSGGYGNPSPRVFEIGFPADLPANGASTYLLYYGTLRGEAPPKAEPRVPLRYEGENPGTAIDSGDVTFKLNPLTGSLLNFVTRYSTRRQKYAFVQSEERDIHYNPDVWTPPLGWGHTSDWDLRKPGPYTPEIGITQSLYAYRSFRYGLMPRSNETKTTKTYTFFAGMPFFYQTSSMEFTLNTLVNAVRNSELVFNRGQMTHGVWADEQGNPQEGVVYDPDDPGRIFDKVAVVPPDTSYIGLFDEQDGAGIALVNLGRYVDSYSPAADTMNLWSQYYIYDSGMWLNDKNHPDWAFIYITRPEIYYPTIVPKGSIFLERNAILIFKVGRGDNRFDDLLRWVKLLRTPPQVTVAPVGVPPK